MGYIEHVERILLLEGKTQYQIGKYFMKRWTEFFPGEPDLSGLTLRSRGIPKHRVILWVEEYRNRVSSNRALDLLRKVGEFVKLEASKGIGMKTREPGHEPW